MLSMGLLFFSAAISTEVIPYSPCQKISLVTASGVSVLVAALGAAAFVVASVPSYGDAFNYTVPHCAPADEMICIDSCTTGCWQHGGCLPGSWPCPRSGRSTNDCMVSYDSSHVIDNASECAGNMCRGGAACLRAGMPVEKVFLYNPDAYSGTSWGRIIAGFGGSFLIIGIVATAIFVPWTCCAFATLSTPT